MGVTEVPSWFRITSPQNPRIRHALSLQRRKVREQTGQFLIEGVRELARAVAAGISIELVFVSEQSVESESTLHLLNALAETSDVIQVPESLITRLCYRGSNSGVIAIARCFSLDLDHLPTSSNGLFLIAVGLEKPGNLGAILRSADAVGATAVIVADQVLDIWNPNVVRSSLGTLFSVPIARASLNTLCAWCTRHNIALVATSPAASLSYRRHDYRGSTGIVVGCESEGLSQEWLDLSYSVVSLPQEGQADSINAAMAATVMLFEAHRQRQKENE